MQLSKAGKVKIMFNPSPRPNIAFADSDIVVRIVTNLISNAIKFSTFGGVQPFVCPLEDILLDEEECDEVSSMQCSYLHLHDAGKVELKIPNTNKRFVAIGVADTGSGLSKRRFKDAESAVSPCDPDSVDAHGVRNSGFGLHLIHLLAKALGSRLRLTSLDKCRKILSPEMFVALDKRQIYKAHMKENGAGNNKSMGGISGKGTVLYITLPVYEDGESAVRALEEKPDFGGGPLVDFNVAYESSKAYTFLPRPPGWAMPGAGSFRILVADDVLMLRKGIVNTLSHVFTDCPVSISTACSAEDMIRAVRENPYDMIICDHLFHHDASTLQRIEKATNDEGCHQPPGRPSVFLNAMVHSRKDMRDILSTYFSDERFTLEEGDGEMTGLEAILKLAQELDPPFPTPLLMLLSGNTLDVPRDAGIIVAQKPLKQGEFIKILESSAPRLLAAGVVHEDAYRNSSCSDTASMTSDSGIAPTSSSTGSSETSSNVPVVNGRGAQIFILQN